MSELGRISTAIENRYRDLSVEARRLWGMKGAGPRLEVQAHTLETAGFMLRGRTRTLANRRFAWDHEGGDGTLEELLGAPNGCKPLDRKLAGYASSQALRAAMASHLGLRMRSMPADRILIDRFVAHALVREHGAQVIADMARAARMADGDEKDPNGQITMTSCGRLQFGVSGCEVDLDEDHVRRPQIRASAVTVGKDAEYIHGRLQMRDRRLPDTLALAAAGRPLRDVVDTGEPMLADRRVHSVYMAGATLIVRLDEDLVEMGEFAG